MSFQPDNAAWAKLNRLSVSSTSSTEGYTDTESMPSFHRPTTPLSSNSSPHPFLQSLTNPVNPSFLSLASPANPISSPPNSLSPIQRTSNNSTNGLTIEVNLPVLETPQVDTPTAEPEGNPLGILTPTLGRRPQIKSPPPGRALTSQDSKLALFGNLFGPAPSTPPSPMRNQRTMQLENDDQR